MNIDPNTTKYMVKARITADGVVEKPDVVGAIFGQTEGLLGDELDLRDLQKSGRIGRIEVEINSKGGKSDGIIYMSSSLDQVETVILASALETVDRVGPCRASIHVLGIEDVRVTKREKVVERAKELLNELIKQSKGSSTDLTDSVRQSVQVEEITSYGKDRCPAGPNVRDSEAIIIVEGRSDVLNLLKAGIKNAIAVEGTNIPPTVQELSRERVATAFVDGDRGGELILRELFQVAEIDFVARAPRAHEVEELTSKQIIKCLRNKVPGDQYMEMNGLVPSGEKASPEVHEERSERPPRDREDDAEARREREERRERRGRDREERRERRERQRREREEQRELREREEASEEASGETPVEAPAEEVREEKPERQLRGREQDRQERRERREREKREKREEASEERQHKERFSREAVDKYRKKPVVQDEPVEPAPVVEEVVAEAPVAVEESAPAIEEPVVETSVVEEPVAEAPVIVEEPAPVVEEKPKRSRSLRGKKGGEKILTEEQSGFRDLLLDLSSTHNAKVLGEGNELIREVAVKNLVNSLKEDSEGAKAIVFDGVISQRILDVSADKGIGVVVGTRKGNITKMPADIVIWTKEDLY